LSDLLLAIDYSKDFRFVGMVVARESVIKSSEFLNLASWVKHVADLPRREKIAYLHRFPKRLAKIRSYLEHVLVVRGIEEANRRLVELKPDVVLVDNALYSYVHHPRKVMESRVKERHRRVLMLLTDNVAYYAYWVLNVLRDPRKLREVLW